ncbi:MAG: C-terminal target protein, partial [Spirosoma sp.]|nr:C-terminal target protein [Spirosoma sp.]
SPATGNDGATMASADAGSNANEDQRLRILAAAQLFRTTGTTKYKTFFESNYNNTGATNENNFHPLSSGYMDASSCWELNQAYIIYWGAAGADAGIVSQLKNTLKNTMDWFHEPKYIQKDDPYLAYMFTGHYTWGSNELKARWGQLAVLALENNVNSAKNNLYREIAEEYLHYFHGRNPLSWVYLSNMGTRGANVGGDKNVEEFFHSWFRDGSSRYDGPNSQFGAAPGYVVGGPNYSYSGTTAPPKGNPPMKSFAAWNTDYPDPSWEVTEPAIYYQGAYVFLSSYFVGMPTIVQPQPTVSASNNGSCAGQSLNLTASSTNFSGTVSYSWSGPNGFSSTQQNPIIANVTSAQAGTYTVTATSNGSTATASTSVTINPLPTASASSNGPISAGQTLNLMAVGAGTGASYSWSGPNSFNSTSQNPSVANAGTANSGTYTLTVGLSGCSSTTTTNVTVNAVAASTNIIYDDALKTGWADYSWGTTRNLNDNSPVQSGSNSISVTYTEAYGGLYLNQNSPLSLAGYSHLKFWVNGGKTGGQKIFIKINGNESNFYTLTIPSKNWTLVTIPLTTFGNPTTLTKLYFQEALGSTQQPEYNIDQIYLANSANAREGVDMALTPTVELEPEVRIYPNPVEAHSGTVSLQFIGFEQNEEVYLTLNDLQGRLMHQTQEKLTVPEKQLSLDQLMPGYYFVQIHTKNKHLSQKILVK